MSLETPPDLSKLKAPALWCNNKDLAPDTTIFKDMPLTAAGDPAMAVSADLSWLTPPLKMGRTSPAALPTAPRAGIDRVHRGGTSEADRQVLLNYMTSLSEQGQPWTSGALCSTQGQPWTSGPLCCTQGQPTALHPEFAGLATPGADPFLGPPASQLPPRVLGDWRSTGNPNFNGLRPQSRLTNWYSPEQEGAFQAAEALKLQQQCSAADAFGCYPDGMCTTLQAEERPFLSPFKGSSGTWAVSSAGSTSTHSPASHTGAPLQATSAFYQAALPGLPGSPPFNLPGAGLPSPLSMSAQSSQELLQQRVRILSAKCQELLLLSRSQSETIEDLERQLANQTAAPQVKAAVDDAIVVSGLAEPETDSSVQEKVGRIFEVTMNLQGITILSVSRLGKQSGVESIRPRKLLVTLGSEQQVHDVLQSVTRLCQLNKDRKASGELPISIDKCLNGAELQHRNRLWLQFEEAKFAGKQCRWVERYRLYIDGVEVLPSDTVLP